LPKFQMYNLLKVLYKIINFYTQHFPFPHRGWKYMRSMLRALHLDENIYRKKIHHGIYLLVNASDHVQLHLFWYGYYEKDTIALWRSLIRKDGIIVDIGANIGYYSVIAAQKATDGLVYAFEPSSKTYAQLLDNIATNGLHNIEALPMAVGAPAGMQPFYVSGPDNTAMSGLREAENFSGITEMVNVVSFDEWAAATNITRVDCIKMDIEGAETDALLSMKQTLLQQQPVLFIEIREHLLKSFGHSPAGIYQFLFSLGYMAYSIVDARTLKKAEGYMEADSIVFAPAGYLFPPGITIQ